MSSKYDPQWAVEKAPNTGSGGSEHDRLSRPTLFMEIAKLFGRRSSCPRAAVGCIAVLEGRIVASGYVGAPHGQPHCLDVGCEMENGHCVRTIHAESNLVAWAARTGTSLLGTTVWCTHSPCRRCAQLLANVGVKHMIWNEQYDTKGTSTLRSLGVKGYNFDDYPKGWA